MNKECATEIRDHTLKAFENLNLALIAAKDGCDNEEYEKIKKIIGITIGRVDTELLCYLYDKFPDLES